MKTTEQAEIERLRGLLRRVSGGVGHYHGSLGPCDACDIEAALEGAARVESYEGQYSWNKSTETVYVK